MKEVIYCANKGSVDGEDIKLSMGWLGSRNRQCEIVSLHEVCPKLQAEELFTSKAWNY